MNDFWQGFFTGLLFFCSIWNIVTMTIYKIKLKQLKGAKQENE